MPIKQTIPTNSSDSVQFGNATTPVAAQVTGAEVSTGNGYLAMSTTASGVVNERMRIDKDGNVIITSNPSTLWYGDTSAGSFVKGTNTGGYLIFGTSATERMRVDPSGNVGIGTTSPVMDGNGALYVSAINSNGGTFNAGASQSGTANFVGGMQFVNTVLGTTDKRIATIGGITNGATNSGALVFNTWSAGTGAERMRIDSSGKVLISTTTNVGAEKLGIVFDGSTGQGINIKTTFSGNGSGYIGFYNSAGTPIGNINQATGSTVQYATSSDYRLKDNITPMVGALNTIAQLNPVTYTWKSDNSAGQGFIAHELAEIIPDCVVGEKDAVNEDGTIKPQMIDTSFLVATLTAAIQELSAKVTALEAQLGAK